VAGAELYKQHCGVCHGLPLSPKTAIATGMYPRPPQLFQGKGVTDDEPGETYWKIFNGIRLTGMPGFSKTLSETQMWQMALLLANADKLPPAAKRSWSRPSERMRRRQLCRLCLRYRRARVPEFRAGEIKLRRRPALTHEPFLALSCKHGVWPSQKTLTEAELYEYAVGALAPHAVGCGVEAPAA